jgi:hypothetical protein
LPQPDLLLDPAFDLDNGEEIIDDVTVTTMVSGRRKVASTERERIEAIHLMVLLGHGVRIIANHIGISIDEAKRLISQAGYQIVPDPMYRRADGSDGNRTHITKVAA